MNKDVRRVLDKLKREGFTLEQGRTAGVPTLVAPSGERRAVSGDFKAIRAWANKRRGIPPRGHQSHQKRPIS